jgi:hypothetical protein
MADVKFRALYLNANGGNFGPLEAGLALLDDGTPVWVTHKIEKLKDQNIRFLSISDMPVEDKRVPKE